jgi:hypothetical protein
MGDVTNIDLNGNIKTGGIKSAVNSSETALLAAATFTGEEEINNYSDVMVQVETDQNGELYMEFSPDGTNWDTSLTFYYYTDRINPPHILVKGYRYYRTRFTNTSASNQTYLRLNTYFGQFNKLTASINGTLAENYDAIVTRPTNFHYEVAMGKRQGNTTVNKWGYNSDVDTGTSPEIIAAFGGTFNIMTTAGTLDVSSSSANDTNAAGSGARQIIIEGIDANSDHQSEIINLNGATKVTTSNTWLGVNRSYVITSGTSDYNEGNIAIVDTAGTYGNQAYIPATESVTQQCIYHTRENHTFLTDWLYIGALKLSGGSTPTVTIKGFSYSRVTNTVYKVFRAQIDTAVENHLELTPSQPFVIGGREVLYFTVDTDTNNTEAKLRFSGIEERND